MFTWLNDAASTALAGAEKSKLLEMSIIIMFVAMYIINIIN